MAPPNHNTWVVLPFAGLAVFGSWAQKRLPMTMAQTDLRWLRWSSRTIVIIMCIFVVLIMLTGRQESSPFLYENF